MLESAMESVQRLPRRPRRLYRARVLNLALCRQLPRLCAHDRVLCLVVPAALPYGR
jgi:hypothetical protein